MPTPSVIDLDFGETKPHVAGDGWDKPVHFSVEPDILDHILAESFQRAAVVVEFDSGNQGDKPVSEG